MKKSVNEASSVGVSAYSDTEPDFGNWLDEEVGLEHLEVK